MEYTYLPSMIYYLYEILRPKETKDPRRYIGVSSNPKRRYKEHRKSKYFIGHFIRKYSDAYLSIIEEFNSAEEAFEAEKALVPGEPCKRVELFLLNETEGGNMPPICYGNTYAVGAFISDSEKAKRSKRMKKIAKNRSKEYYIKCVETRKRNAKLGLTKRSYKTYEFYNPQQEKVDITNLKQFCKEQGLNYPSMVEVYKKTRNVHKGWTCI